MKRDPLLSRLQVAGPQQPSPSQSTPLLSCDAVSKNFAGVSALSEVSVSVSGAQIVGLIGPNGSGKTTLLNCVSGVLTPSGGRITISGKDLTGRPPYVCSALGVARTFQNLRLFGGLSVRDNVMIGGHLDGTIRRPIRRLRGRREHADQLMKSLDLDRHASIVAGRLPYGLQRRVEIARALMTKPRLLLLDEPAAGMNHVEATRLGEIFRELAGQRIGILLIEHNVSLVTSVSDYVYVLDAGRNLAEGLPGQVMADPNVVKAYLG